MNFSKTKKNSSSKQSLGGQKIVPILFLASLLVIWELACKLFSIPLYVLPSPVQVIQSLFTESATLSHHAAVTVMEAVIGILLSLILAIVLGILMDCFPLVRQGIYPLLVVTQTVPMIVLAPILIIYMGFGIAPKILTVILMCFFPIAVSFSDGLAQVDEEYVHLVRSYGASRLSAYRLVKIPAAIPALLSGLKVSATYSISGSVSHDHPDFRIESSGHLQHQLRRGRGVDCLPEWSWLLPDSGKKWLYAGSRLRLRSDYYYPEPVHEWTHPDLSAFCTSLFEK